MSLWPLVRRLEAEGFRFALEAGRLRVAPVGRLAPVDRETLRAHREELAQALSEDARYLAEERAGILEHEAGMSRADAEHLAGLPRRPSPLQGRKAS